MKNSNNFLFRFRYLRFGLIVLFLLIVWKLFYNNWINGSTINDPLSAILGHVSSNVLNELGFSSYCKQVDLSYPLHLQRVTIFIKKMPMVTIDDSCNGLELYVLMFAFVIAYGGGRNNGYFIAFFILISFLTIFFINILRIVLLTILAFYKTPYFEFYHYYVFAAIVYLVILGMMWLWTYWVNQSLLKEKIVD
jgi:exosortase/archaeosortase family protein